MILKKHYPYLDNAFIPTYRSHLITHFSFYIINLQPQVARVFFRFGIPSKKDSCFITSASHKEMQTLHKHFSVRVPPGQLKFSKELLPLLCLFQHFFSLSQDIYSCVFITVMMHSTAWACPFSNSGILHCLIFKSTTGTQL